MIKKLQAMKKNAKGFTLVELIVVLVILAILAALLLPTLTKYIDKANEMKAESACRMCVMATKSEVGTAYGKLAAGSVLPEGDLTTVISPYTTALVNGTTLRELAEIPKAGETTKTYTVAAKVKTTGEVTEVVYKNAVYTCTYDGSGFTVEKPSGGNSSLDNKFTVTAAA